MFLDVIISGCLVLIVVLMILLFLINSGLYLNLIFFKFIMMVVTFLIIFGIVWNSWLIFEILIVNNVKEVILDNKIFFNVIVIVLVKLFLSGLSENVISFKSLLIVELFICK